MPKLADIKAWTRHVIKFLGGNSEVDRRFGLAGSEVSYWCSDNHSRFIPIDHLMELDAQAGDLFLKEWARCRGYDLVAVEKNHQPLACLLRETAALARAEAELTGEIIEMDSDGVRTPAEIRRVRDRIAPVKDRLSGIEGALG